MVNSSPARVFHQFHLEQAIGNAEAETFVQIPLYSTVATLNGNFEVAPSMGMYNARAKFFPNGGMTYTFYDFGINVGHARKSRPKSEDMPPGDPERSEREARKRARSAVYDIARSNTWDWFLTLTLDPKRVNRWDYDACAAEVMRFADVMRKAGNQYIIVPEQHDNGAWHFHALVVGALKVKPAVHYWTGSLLQDRKGRQIYNVLNYKYGWNTATEIGESEKAAAYIAKYMLKNMHIPKGKKRYWASKSLQRPEIEYSEASVKDQEYYEETCDFQKTIEMKFGRVSICDFRVDYWDRVAEFKEIGYDTHEDIFVQIDPEFSWEPLEGEQLSIEQNINCCRE